MQRLTRVLATAAVASVVAGLGSSTAWAQRPQMQGQTVRLMHGSITGTVSDDRGGPLAGALVSALGATMVSTVSDSRGYFSLDALPIGEYVLQAHLTGFGGSPRERRTCRLYDPRGLSPAPSPPRCRGWHDRHLTGYGPADHGCRFRAALVDHPCRPAR